MRLSTSGRSFFKHFARISRLCTPTAKEISAPTLSSFSAIANLSSVLVPRSSIIPVSVGIAMLPDSAMASPAGNAPKTETTSCTLVR